MTLTSSDQYKYISSGLMNEYWLVDYTVALALPVLLHVTGLLPSQLLLSNLVTVTG